MGKWQAAIVALNQLLRCADVGMVTAHGGTIKTPSLFVRDGVIVLNDILIDSIL